MTLVNMSEIEQLLHDSISNAENGPANGRGWYFIYSDAGYDGSPILVTPRHLQDYPGTHSRANGCRVSIENVFGQAKGMSRWSHNGARARQAGPRTRSLKVSNF